MNFYPLKKDQILTCRKHYLSTVPTWVAIILLVPVISLVQFHFLTPLYGILPISRTAQSNNGLVHHTQIGASLRLSHLLDDRVQITIHLQVEYQPKYHCRSFHRQLSQQCHIV